jgi:gliding motility-associated-like protein
MFFLRIRYHKSAHQQAPLFQYYIEEVFINSVRRKSKKTTNYQRFRICQLANPSCETITSRHYAGILLFRFCSYLNSYYFEGEFDENMTPRLCRPFTLGLVALFTILQGYGQVPLPGCGTPYKGDYSPPSGGSLNLYSTAIGPDGCIYAGCVDYPWYSLMKLDSNGNKIRITSYAPAGIAQSDGPGKTVFDYDGNLFSYFHNNFILKTDTAGNILSGKKLSSNNGFLFGLLNLNILANGNKVFLFWGTNAAGYQSIYVVVTSPDASTILWTKYFWSYNEINAGLLADGNKIILGLSVDNDYYAPNGTTFMRLDAGTGDILQQRWFSQEMGVNHIFRYKNGYIFDGNGELPTTIAPGYIRTDTLLNVITSNYLPAYFSSDNVFPVIFQPQTDGSVYGFYSSGTTSMAFFLISAEDAVQWATGMSGFYQTPVTMNLASSGILIGTDIDAINVIIPGSTSGIQLYKSSYSGNFAPCVNSAPVTLSMTPSPLTPVSPFSQLRDTSAFNISNYTIQETSGPVLTGSTCTGLPSCNSLRITGNPNICNGSGTFAVVTNSGCSLPITWSVTKGPGTTTIQSPSNNTASISFSQRGSYMVKAMASANCSVLEDSLVVNVNEGANFYLGGDTTLCAGNSLLLHAGSYFNSYTWQDGSTDSTLLVTASGEYSVIVVDYCGNSYTSSINVSYLPLLTSPFPANVTKCPDDTLSLPFPPGFDSVYFLSPAVNGRVWEDSVQFFNPGMANYSLQEKDDHGCTVNSTIAVQVYPEPALHIGDNRTICPGDSVLLDPGTGFNSYQWSTGSRNQAIWAVAKGIYWVRATAANGCTLRDSMVLDTWPAPVANLDPDTLLCAGSTRTLTANNGFVSYLWNDGSTASTLSVSSTGQYWVTVTDGQGCSAADTVNIKALAPLPVNFLPADTTICQYSSVTLYPDGDFSSYLWSDGSTASSITIQSPGLYTLQVTDKNGCTGSDSIGLTGKQCLIGFYIPNAFTPNNDGKNDVFRPLIYGNVVRYKFAIFNRWGQQVFESKELLLGWDGTVRGAPQPTSAFVWSCTYQLQGQDMQSQRGTVMLIR